MKPPGGPPEAVRVLEDRLATLPGVGKVTARRLAYHLLRIPTEEALALAQAITSAREEIFRCRQCGNLGADDPCWICRDPERDQQRVCIVEDARDLLALEKARVFNGLYQVLPARLSPLTGAGPEVLETERLRCRLAELGAKEVILATNPDQEGEATASHLAGTLMAEGLTITRIARGIPAGAAIEQVQATILSDAFSGRRPL